MQLGGKILDKWVKHSPLLVGSLELNLRLYLVDSLGTPEERFMENLRLLKDIFAGVDGQNCSVQECNQDVRSLRDSLVKYRS
jgi:hypothetical protein